MIVSMLSGGLDSTAMTLKLLRESEPSSVHIHHIAMENIERRGDAELRSVARILEYLSKDFQFTTSLSRFSFPGNVGGRPFLPFDVHVIALNVGLFCSSPNVHSVAVGIIADDIVGEPYDRVDNIVTTISGMNKKIYPVRDMTKQQIIDFLPKELRKHTWSCRTPVRMTYGYVPCGRCKACTLLATLNT